MAGETSVAVRVLAIVSLVALADRASCQLALADRALPPTVVCGAVGRFPDPTDCHFYLECSTDGSSGYTQTITHCPDGTYYDACTGNCSTQFEGECTIPCNIDNLITDSAQNPGIIFVCHIDASGSSTITVSTCSTEFERLGICSSSAKQCRQLSPAVTCGAVGRFPDPTDCHFYLDCSTDGSSGYTQTITLCPDGTYYDACTGNCSTQFEGECTIPCNTDNLITNSVQNPGIIFVCHIDASGSSTITVSTCSTELERLGICSSSAKQCEPLPEASMCKELGAGYHTDEKDCSVYYYCNNEDASPVKLVCPTGQYFDMSSHSCVKFQCTSIGAFADPLDCMRYYVCYLCGLGLCSVHNKCSSGGHFDSSTESCVTGICPAVCPVA